MEPLILEIKTRGLHQYHVLDKPRLRVGRALDNDIILSDTSVAPHQLLIICHDDGQVELRNLAAINPTRLNGHLRDSMITAEMPIDLELGRITAQVLPRNHVVSATRPLAGHSRPRHMFKHTFWAVALVALCLMVAAAEIYFASYHKVKLEELVWQVLSQTALRIAAFALILSVLEHLLVNRWEVKPIVVSVAVVFIIYHLLAPLFNELNYVFSSELPTTLYGLAWYLVFIPLAIMLYLTRVTHLRVAKSLLLASLISAPFILVHLVKSPAMQSLFNDFSATANYQKSLSPINWHLQKTSSIGEFIAQAEQLKPGTFSD